LWFQLPPELETAPVHYANVQPDEVPRVGNTRIFHGEFGGQQGVADIPVAFTYLDVQLKKGETWRYTPPEDHTRGFVFARNGRLVSGDTTVHALQLGILADEAGEVVFTAAEDTEFILVLAPSSPHPMITGPGQIHTSHEALAASRERIVALGRALHAQGVLA